jgi:chromosome segregation ATPase
MKKLKKTNEKLKKFDGVNKKALDQFMSFTEQRDDLQGRETNQILSNRVWHAHCFFSPVLSPG